MSGKQFVAALKRIGYPSADDLDYSSFDWMFDNEEFLPFLQWFCDEIQPSNVLSPSELNEYSLLESSSEGVLEGEHLERALQNLALFEKDVLEMPDEKIHEEVEFLKKELSNARQQKDVLAQQYGKLTIQATALSDRLEKIGAVDDAKQLEYRKTLEQIQLENLKLNAALDSLVPAVDQLTSIYHTSASGTDIDRQKCIPVFLSHLDLEPYHKVEERYTQALIAFTKKQFFEGIAEMTGQNEGSRYEFLEICNPDSLLIRGKTEEVGLDDCKELARIHALYPVSEIKRINALIEERRIVAACNFHEQMQSQLRHQPYPTEIAQLSSRLKNAQTHLSVLSKEISQIADLEMMGLIKESASLQATKILCGDYDLKIARQDYFTRNQDQMIEHLIRQRARCEFVSMALEMESRSHREIKKLLLAISVLLKQMHASLKNRMKMMSEIEELSNQLQRTTVDSRDKFLHHIYQTLNQADIENEEKQQKKLFVTYEDLEQSAKKLMHRVEGIQSSLQAASHRQNGNIAQLEQDLARCEVLLYPDNGSINGLPVLGPPVILETMSRLDGLLSKLEEAVMDIMKDVNKKKKSLQNDFLMTTERELYVYFYNDANRLRRVLEQLNSRLQVVKNK